MWVYKQKYSGLIKQYFFLQMKRGPIQIIWLCPSDQFNFQLFRKTQKCASFSLSAEQMCLSALESRALGLTQAHFLLACWPVPSRPTPPITRSQTATNNSKPTVWTKFAILGPILLKPHSCPHLSNIAHSIQFHKKNVEKENEMFLFIPFQKSESVSTKEKRQTISSFHNC